MRKNFGPKSYMYPMPVLIIASYNEDGSANAMNAAWGIICDRDKISLYLSGTHQTVKNILARGAFTVSMANAEHVVAADYVGLVSGKDVPDKLARAGFHTTKSEFVDAPVIDELPMVLECKLLSYDHDSECMIGEIVNVAIDESVLTEDGKVDVAKFGPISYDPVNRYYYKLGEKAGNAFKDGAQLK